MCVCTRFPARAVHREGKVPAEMDVGGLPQAVVLGASKSGTTWLWNCLGEHPSIYVPARPKELHYFSRMYDRGAEWYASHYSAAGSEEVCVDNSPSYLADPSVPERIASLLPHAGLLALLRHPVERAYSHYCMLLQAGRVCENPDKELLSGNPLVEYGFYARHLKRYLEHFSDDQVIVRLYDDIGATGGRVISDFYDFLGLDSSVEPKSQVQRIHPRRPRPRFQRTYNAAVRFIKAAEEMSPRVGSSIYRVRKSPVMDRLHHLSGSASPYPRLSRDAWLRLLDLYSGDIEELGQLLMRDLGEWLAREPPRDERSYARG